MGDQEGGCNDGSKAPAAAMLLTNGRRRSCSPRQIEGQARNLQNSKEKLGGAVMSLLQPTDADVFPSVLNKGSTFRQIRASLIANSAVMHPGMMFAFSSVALPQMQHEDSDIIVSPEQASWIASVASFATPPGCLLGGLLMERCGRRAALLLLALPCIAGWLTVGAVGLWPNVLGSWAVPVIYAGRVMQGIGTGIVAGASRVYTSEVSNPDLRGSLCSLASLGVTSGVLLCSALGALVSWPLVALLASLVPFTSLVLSLIYLPETPTWLLQHGRHPEAKAALARLRDPALPTEVIDLELTQLGGVEESQSVSKIKTLTQASTLRPFFLVVLYFVTYQFSGISVLTFYNVRIIKQSAAPVNSYATSVCFGVLRLVCNVCGCFLLAHCGRRTLTLCSGLASGMAMLGLGTHFYVLTFYDGVAPYWPYLPIVCIASFYVSYSLGYLLVPWVLTGEMFPAKVRGVVGGVVTSCAHTFLFAAVKTFPLLWGSVGYHGAFWLYGCTVGGGAVLLYILLPETNGRSLLEIEAFFTKSKDKSRP